MGAPRAFRLLKGGGLSGLLGEGPGPFVTATRSSLPAPQLAVARFVSRDVHAEAAISRVLVDASDFDGALADLAAAGFELEPLDFSEAFGPLGGLG